MKTIDVVAILFLVSLLIAPASAVALSISERPITGQQEEVPIEILEQLLNEGAEIAIGVINADGVPNVIYGQLGIASDELDLDNPSLYGGCIAMAIVSTHGEFLEYVFSMLGLNMTQQGLMYGELGGRFVPAQMTPPNIFETLGTEFNLLVSAYVNLDSATSSARMNGVLAHLTSQFQFSFSYVYNLRVDESIFPPEMNITLPFDSLDVYIYAVTNSFTDAVNAVFRVMRAGGFKEEVDRTLITESRAAAAGVLAIPDIEALIDIIGSFNVAESTPVTLADVTRPEFLLSQMPNITGPVAIAAVGYIGEQVISDTSTHIGMSTLLGADRFDPLDAGQSFVMMVLPQNANITSYSPVMANASMYDNETNIILWNATAFGLQSDYIVYFESDDFPPLIELRRTFSSTVISIGGSTQVTVTLTNRGNSPITNVNLTDRGVQSLYSSVAVSGTTSRIVPSLAPNESVSMTYTVTFVNEGKYKIPKASVTYKYNNNTFSKTTYTDAVLVQQSLTDVLARIILDGMPFTGGLLALVVLVGLYSIRGIIKARGVAGTTYQPPR